MNNEEDIWNTTFEVADAIEMMILNVASVMDEMVSGMPSESRNRIKAKYIKSLLDITTEEDIFQILSKYDFKFPDSGN